jgi:hypothetical protein
MKIGHDVQKDITVTNAAVTDDTVANTLCTLQVHRPTLFDTVAGADDTDGVINELGRSLVFALLGGEAGIAERVHFSICGIKACDFDYPAPGDAKAASAPDTSALRVKPLEFEKMGGLDEDFLVADSGLATYQIHPVKGAEEFTLTLCQSGSKLRETLSPFPTRVDAIKAAEEHHIAQVADLLEPEDAKRTKASLRLLADALAHLPDEIEIYRLIKAPKESSRHADIAKRIAAHLAPALAAVDLFKDEMETKS